jgi:hypothetical protein
MLTKYNLIFLPLLFVVFSISILGQKCEVGALTKNSINVDMIPSNAKITPSQILLFESMKKVLKKENLLAPKEDSKIDYSFYVNAKDYQSSTESLLLVSIVVFKKIPPKIVEVWTQDEAFYKYVIVDSTNTENLTDLGRKIRKQISFEYIQNFGTIEYQLYELLSKEKVDQFCQLAIEKFLTSRIAQ